MVRHAARCMTRPVLVVLAELVVLASLAAEPCTGQVPSASTPAASSPDDYAARALAGISGQARNKRQPYVTAGDRTYLIGTQDGNFPDMGHHVPGEMGGLWLPPIKLLDTFEARIAEAGLPAEVALAESTGMVTYPYGTLFRYDRTLDELNVERFQFSPDQQQGLIVQYRFRNQSDHARHLRFRWFVKTDLRPGWYADHLGTRDGDDAVKWDADAHVFIARDTDNPWFCVWGA